MIALAIRIGLLLCSTLGYIGWLYKKGIEIAFGPILVSAGIGLTMFVAGLLNLMPHCVVLIFFGGLLCFGCMGFEVLKKRVKLSSHELIVLGFFTCLVLFMALRLRGILVWPFDNYSHWLTVVKDMLRYDRMPNFTSPMIRFQGYPTGTAGFIYYVAKIVGEADGIFLLAQSILYISCLTCFWAFAKKQHLISALVILPASVFLLTCNNQVDDLCVDTMLALLGIAGFSLTVYHKENIRLASLFNCLLSCYIITVKNSGVFFVIVHFVLILGLFLRAEKGLVPASRRKSLIKLTAGNLGLPLLLFYLWKRHVDYVFIDGGASLHSMNVERFTSEFGNKTTEEISTILSAFGKWLITVDASKILVLLLLAMYFIACIVKKANRQSPSSDCQYLFWTIFSCMVYLPGILAMYLLSMQAYEAVHLASIHRYFGTLVQYLVGIGVIYILCDLEKKDNASTFRRVTACIMLCFALFSAWERIPFLFHNPRDYSQTSRNILRDILDEYGIPEESGYYILYNENACTDGEGVGYFRFVAQYELWTYGFFIDDAPDPQKAMAHREEILNHEYLIVLYEDETVNQFIEALGLTPGQRAYHLAPLRES